MRTKVRSINQIIEEQAQRWRLLRTGKAKEKLPPPVITISREPGSGGKIVAQGIAESMALDIFHQEVVHQMADSSQVSARLVETLDEKGLTILEDWINSLVKTRHLWPDQYLQHLMKVIGTIGKHGSAVIVGRGANFVLPREKRLSVRIVAPQQFRIENVAREYGVPAEEAKRRVIRTESDRRSFVRKYFNSDIADPLNYDIVLNLGALSIQEAAKAVCAVAQSKATP